MYDPSIFDNLKIVLEGAVYDRDLDERWIVLGREDLIDLAQMSRTFRIRFSAKPSPGVVATVTLGSELKDFAAEWLQQKSFTPGCFLEVSFLTSLKDSDLCATIAQQLTGIWGGRPIIRQHLSFPYPQQTVGYQNDISLHFDRKIDESNISDIDSMLDHVSLSLEYLNNMHLV
jgi:hypothetical protein